jgi:hypothetical protein
MATDPGQQPLSRTTALALIFAAAPYVGAPLFMLVALPAGERPWFTMAVVWLLLVRVAVVVAARRRFAASAADRSAGSSPSHISVLGAAFLIESLLLGAAGLFDLSTVFILWLPYFFLGTVLLLIAQSQRTAEGRT